jgi:hypothetical protein
VAVEGVDIVDGGVLSVARTVLDVEKRRKRNQNRLSAGNAKDLASKKGSAVSRPDRTCLAGSS